ncbi:MAG: hypothetical protein AAF206_20420, partial [Bacteroidota bacterium]
MFGRRSKKQERLTELADQWESFREMDRELESISRYHQLLLGKTKHKHLNQKVIDDLDLLNVFAVIDHTESSIGQQYLYHTLCTPQFEKTALLERERRIEALCAQQDNRLDIQYSLDQMMGRGDSYIPLLFLSEFPEKPKWFWLIRCMQLLVGACLMGAIIFPFLLIPLIVILPINAFLHYANKRNISLLFLAFQRLRQMHRCGQQLQQLADEHFPAKETLGKLGPIVRKVAWLSTDNFQNRGEIMGLIWNLIELLKMLFLIDVGLFHQVRDDIRKEQQSIHQLYVAIGEIDVCLSIASLRASDARWHLPEFLSAGKQISVQGICHPTVPDCVPNDLALNGRSVLLTGSNMAGKTTFIRTIAINAILAQTIHCVLAEKYMAPFWEVYSQIRISDSVEDAKSYYQAEVEGMKDMLVCSEETSPQKLF